MRVAVILAAAAAVACGGGIPADPAGQPTVVVLGVSDQQLVNGDVSFSVVATGVHADIESLVFEQPAALAGTVATKDSSAHTATLTASIHSADFPDGPLPVKATAIDSAGQHASALVTLKITSDPLVSSLDEGYGSFYDELGIRVTTSGQYQYASSSKVAVIPGLVIQKVVTRMATSSSPTAAELQANASNVPVARILAPLSGSTAITEAKAAVAIEGGSAVTVDLIADSSSPANQQAYLLPLTPSLFPDLSRLASTVHVSMRATTRDALGHTSEGGPWQVQIVPLAPPLIVTIDGGYKTSADERSVFPYAGSNYSLLWGSGLTGAGFDGGQRLYHVVINNPASDPVSLGATLGGASSWNLDEMWSAAHHDDTLYISFTRTCTGSGQPTCTNTKNGGTANSVPSCHDNSYPYNSSVLYHPANSSSWSCVSSSYTSGPAPKPMNLTGSLGVMAYQAGTAATRSGSRFVVPGGGKVDLYVVRPVPSRSVLPLPWTWTGRVFEAGTSYTTVECVGSECANAMSYSWACPVNSCPKTWVFNQYDWDWALTSATEKFSGTLAVDARAFDQGASVEFGPLGSALDQQSLPSDVITHK
jgi:hypothetical protein